MAPFRNPRRPTGERFDLDTELTSPQGSLFGLASEVNAGALAGGVLMDRCSTRDNAGCVTLDMPQLLQRTVLGPHYGRKIRRPDAPFPSRIYGRVSLEIRTERAMDGSRDVASVAHT